MALSSITPAVAGVAGGTRCFLFGSGLAGATGVTFGGVPGTDFVIVSSTSLYVTAPAHALGVVDVVVTVGLGTLAGGFAYRAETATHALTWRADALNTGTWTAVATGWGDPIGKYNGDSAAQTFGAHTGPTTFLGIEGGPLDDGVIPGDATIDEIHSRFDWQVVLTGANTVLVVISQGSTFATVTGNASGTLRSGIATPGGTWAAYLAAHVQAYGFRFQSANGAQPGGTARLIITNFQILVTASGGTRVTRVVPAQGRTAGGRRVTITGTGFTGTPVVTFGGVAATSVTVVSSTRITARTPAHAAGLVAVVVDGVSLANGYRYTDSTFGTLTIRQEQGIVIDKALNDAPDQLAFTSDGVSSVTVGAPARILDPASGATLFGGTALVTTDGIDGTPVQPGHQGITAGDLTWRLNARRPFGVWANQSWSVIAQDLIDQFAPQFTGFIEAGLPLISITCDRSQTLSAVLSTGCALAHCAWRPDDDFGVHVFTSGGSPAPGVPPDPITPDTPLYDPPPTVEHDITQVRNRVYVHGAGGASAYDAPVSLPPWAIGPSSSPAGSVTPTTGGSIPTGSYLYFMSYTTLGGETTLTPLVSFTPSGVLAGANTAFQLTNLDSSVHADPRVTGRRIWRTPSGDAVAHVLAFEVFLITSLGNTAGIGDNSFLDTLADAALTTRAPRVDTTGTIFVKVDNVAAQTALAALLNVDGGTDDGIREGYVLDASLTTDAMATARANAELTLFASPIVTVVYACRDEKSIPGADVSITLTRPPVSGVFKIQSVRIDQIQVDREGALFPRFTVTATSVRFTLDDLLRGVTLGGGGTGGAGGGSSSVSAGGGGGVSPAATIVGPAVPTGAINGANTVYATAAVFTRLFVFKNGLLMTLTTDYTITGTAQFTMVVAPVTGDSLVVYSQ